MSRKCHHARSEWPRCDMAEEANCPWAFTYWKKRALEAEADLAMVERKFIGLKLSPDGLTATTEE